MDSLLEQAIGRACRLDSLYLGFLNAEERDRASIREVEIRIDVPESETASLIFDAREGGWQPGPQNIDGGTVFLRRQQSLLEAALFDLFRGALTLAHQSGGRFHSWVHSPDLENHAKAH